MPHPGPAAVTTSVADWPWPWTSAGPSWRRAWSTGRVGCSSGPGADGADPTGLGADAGGEGLWRRLAALVSRCGQEAEADQQVVVCGVGCGGPMSPGGDTVSPLNIGAWRGFPLRARLAVLTGLATFVDNDAKALALGEGWVGAAAGLRRLSRHGGVHRHRWRHRPRWPSVPGRLGNAGHMGHVVVVPDGRPASAVAGGVWKRKPRVRHWPPYGQPAALAPPEWVERTGTLVGRAVASVANLLDLPLALVSGSVALGFGEPFFAAAQREVQAPAALSSPGTRGSAGWPGR